MKNTIETFSALGARLFGFGDDDATRAVIDSACRANGWFMKSLITSSDM